jgi:hypothetical protein
MCVSVLKNVYVHCNSVICQNYFTRSLVVGTLGKRLSKVIKIREVLRIAFKT